MGSRWGRPIRLQHAERTRVVEVGVREEDHLRDVRGRRDGLEPTDQLVCLARVDNG